MNKLKLLVIIHLFIIYAFAQRNKFNNKPMKIDSLNYLGYYLKPYYPNPFSPALHTEFKIPNSCHVKLFVTDSTNTYVIDLIYVGILEPGHYKYDFSSTINKYRLTQKILRGYLNIEASFNKKNNW